MDAERRRALARAPWITRSSRAVYENPWMRLREDIAELPDGRTTIYGVVQCKPAVGVLPFLDEDTVVLVGQYRYVFGEFSWEMPTGGAHPGESPEEAARRELAEEAGYAAAELAPLCEFHTSKSIMEEVAYLYAARGLTPAGGGADPTEFIEVRAFPFAEALAMVRRSEIKDSMTVVAILHAALARGSAKGERDA
jgi:ADP-ribose pyrophosphatase